MAPLLDAVPAVDERMSKMKDALQDIDEENAKHFPGLANFLDTYLQHSDEGTVDRELFIRGLLRVFWKSDDTTYEQVLEHYTADEKKHIKAFVEEKKPASDVAHTFVPSASPSFREEMVEMHAAAEHELMHDVEHFIEKLKQEGKEIKDKAEAMATSLVQSLSLKSDLEEKGLTYRRDILFQNWGRTVQNTPSFTFTPKTTEEVQKIVKFAKAKDLSVRVSGYRHSWSPSFSKTGQVLISTISLDDATNLPNTTSLPFAESPPTELESIDVVPDGPNGPLPGGKKLVRVGVAATNERLRRWCVQNKKLTMPLNVIIVETTVGGVNAPMCHGAGRRHKTLSDLVKRIEYVDAHGELREITENDAEFLKAASGCFGLIGVITHLTLAMDPMTYAVMRPLKLPAALAVPPPKGMKIPAVMDKYSPEELEKARVEFEKRLSQDYYAEIFWFPLSDYCWVNTWNNVEDDSDVVSYPSDVRLFLQFGTKVLLNVLQYTPLLQKLADLTGLNQAGTTLLSRAAMLNMPEVKPGEKPIKTWLPDALHFERSVQNVRVRDLEVEMPLLPKASDPTKPDFALVQQAWWDAILKVYEPENLKTVPMRMPLEMRIMGGSDIIMAPQRGNTLGTCSIEILTLENVISEWKPFAQSVLDKWMGLKDSSGERLKTRPNWAKEWIGYTVDGKPWMHKLKSEDCKEDIAEFKQVLAALGKAHGWQLSDIKRRFGNEMFNELIFDDV